MSCRPIAEQHMVAGIKLDPLGEVGDRLLIVAGREGGVTFCLQAPR